VQLPPATDEIDADELETEKRIPVKKGKRKVRGGIKITIDYRPDILQEAWSDTAQLAIVINKGHPAFESASSMFAESYHMLRCVVSEIIKKLEVKNEEELFADFLRKFNEEQRKDLAK